MYLTQTLLCRLLKEDVGTIQSEEAVLARMAVTGAVPSGSRGSNNAWPDVGRESSLLCQGLADWFWNAIRTVPGSVDSKPTSLALVEILMTKLDPFNIKSFFA